MKTAISSILIMVGIVLMAGSAGDCDGKCMDQANTLGEMMMYAFMGLTLFLTGAIIAIKQ
jgi:hypothetical protein|tara:strand:+ start:39 stop:218 length:180 start_codon:yes stop_codon:yes gene_type:complete